MNIKTTTRVQHEVKHSRERAEERYGLRLSKSDIVEISKIVMSPNRDNKVFMHQQDDGCSHWIVRYRDALYRLVFDERSRTTRTFMEMQPIHEKLWRDTHSNDGKPTLGDVARIKRLKLR